ncbi:hypothetical protein Thermus77923_16730 [Thermus oshimai]
MLNGHSNRNLLAGLKEPMELTPETLAHLEGKPHPLEGLESPERVEGHPRYRVHGGRLEALRVEGRGENRAFTYYPLTNFAARIARQVRLEDGTGEAETLLEIEGWLASGKRLPLARVRASEFPGMAWVGREWGAEAVLLPGNAVKDQTRYAIQVLSLPFLRSGTVYRHLGWTTMDGVPVYLHAGGGIGPEGAVGGLEVEPGRILEGFALPEPPEGVEEVRVWQTLLEVWPRLAPPEAVWPLLLYALGAPLGHVPFALYLSGPTGARKTSLGLAAQNLFAPGLDAPPLGWEATANALEGAAFAAKDSLILIDDYAPLADRNRQRDLEAKAQRIIRNQGNQTGRARMRADGTLAPDRPPRGGLLITGEDLPPGHSIRARSFVLEVERGAVDLGALSEAQALAREGVLARALSAWVRYLAPGLEGYRKRLRSRVEELRPHYPFPHGRTTDAAARLHATLELLEGYWATLGLEVGREAVLAALKVAAAKQEEYQKDADPVEQALAFLASSFATGKAHLRGVDGGEPSDPKRWGWAEDELGRKPQGELLGWIKEGEPFIYLNREAFYRRISQEAWAQGVSLPTPRTLLRIMAQRGVIRAEVEGGKVRFDTKVSVAGGRVRVIALPLYVVESGASGAGTENALRGDINHRPTNPGCPTPSGAGEEGVAEVFALQDEKKEGCPTCPTPGDIRGVELARAAEAPSSEWGEIPDEEVGA